MHFVRILQPQAMGQLPLVAKIRMKLLKSKLLCKPIDWLLYERNISRYPANIYWFKVNNRSTRKRCEICIRLTIKTPERYP